MPKAVWNGRVIAEGRARIALANPHPGHFEQDALEWWSSLVTALQSLATRLGDCLAARAWMAATAESCTGGMVSAALTDIAGSSVVFDCGFVTYSNEAKAQMLGVDARMIARDGAVSESVARAMAEGRRRECDRPDAPPHSAQDQSRRDDPAAVQGPHQGLQPHPEKVP